MTLPRWIGPGALAYLAIWLALLLIGRSGMLRDPGTFWHTTTGEIILSQGFIRHDPYTFTFAGNWWVPYQWLGEVCLALAHRVGGFDTQLLGATALLAGLFAWLSVRWLQTGLHPAIVGALVALSLAAAGSHFLVRPHLFTMAALTVTTILLVDVERGHYSLRHLGWLIPLFVMWTNVHGGVLGGLATLGLTIGGWIVYWLFGRSSPVRSWYDCGLLAVVLLACGLSLLVNPYGWDLVRTWQLIMGEPVLREIIKEHRPFDPSEPYAWPVLAVLALYLFVLVGTSWRELRVTWLLPLVWFVQTVERCRHAPLFVLVGMVVIAAMWQQTRWAARLRVARPDLYAPAAETLSRPRWANVWLPTVFVLVALGLQAATIRVPLLGVGWAQHATDHWPVELLDVLKAHEPRPHEPNRLFNDYRDGGFIIYHTPGYKVFVDDRCEVFGGAWLSAFVAAGQNNTSAAILNWEAQYGHFNFALTRTGTGFDNYFHSSPDWQCLKRVGTAAFYRRR
jgi:hypothetical protein